MIACHRSSPLLIAALALVLLVPRAALGQVASGQEVGPYDPLGIRAGNFFIFPVLSVSEEYQTNVFAEPNDTDDDLITVIQPHVDVRSNFPRHALGLSVGSDIGLHVNETDEDYEDVFATADGQLDVTRASQLSGSLNAGRFHQGRDDPEDPG
ncbi:MAG: outer membrane beta-barrel protein, partial [Geminicoccaceae bacterium]